MLVSRDKYIEMKQATIRNFEHIVAMDNNHTAKCLLFIEERDLEEFIILTENDNSDKLYEID